MAAAKKVTAKEPETKEDVKETPVTVEEPKEKLLDKIKRHKNKILAVGGIGLGGIILAKLARHGSRIGDLEDTVYSDSEDLDDDDVIDVDEDGNVV